MQNMVENNQGPRKWTTVSIPKDIVDKARILIEELDLSFNNLRTVPTSICKLNSLKTLNLIHNNIIELPAPLLQMESNGLKVLF